MIMDCINDREEDIILKNDILNSFIHKAATQERKIGILANIEGNKGKDGIQLYWEAKFQELQRDFKDQVEITINEELEGLTDED